MIKDHILEHDRSRDQEKKRTEQRMLDGRKYLQPSSSATTAIILHSTHKLPSHSLIHKANVFPAQMFKNRGLAVYNEISRQDGGA